MVVPAAALGEGFLVCTYYDPELPGVLGSCSKCGTAVCHQTDEPTLKNLCPGCAIPLLEMKNSEYFISQESAVILADYIFKNGKTN